METSTAQLKRFDHTQGPRKLGPDDGKYVDLQSVGVRFMLWTEESGGSVSVVEHPIPPKTLVAPLHKHSREDEYSFVIEGRMGALLGDDVVYAEAGDFAFKPRAQWHTFWNAGDEPCRILELIVPGGFEHYFDELATILAGGFDPEAMTAAAQAYGLEARPETIPALCEEHGLDHPMLHM
jgi:mannose-6-phosphate isomerase-like protein (cupin superfamily)